mmetsp:Transcript_1623/g.2738  ORF Transcript_1623/g.2738 Transcript_1623/m.2738 type:complete len:102 (-) Transcript_1623:1-306(-)
MNHHLSGLKKTILLNYHNIKIKIKDRQIKVSFCQSSHPDAVFPDSSASVSQPLEQQTCRCWWHHYHAQDTEEESDVLVALDDSASCRVSRISSSFCWLHRQ